VTNLGPDGDDLIFLFGHSEDAGIGSRSLREAWRGVVRARRYVGCQEKKKGKDLSGDDGR